MKAEINRQIEFVQVLLYLADVQDKTCQCINNKEYCAVISEWFMTQKEHLAVTLTRDLVLNKYLFHIKPLRAILSLDTIINDNSNELHKWAVAVKQFMDVSNYDAFFDSQTNYYSWILKNVNTCDFDSWIGFIENYFRQKPDNFKLIICPIAGNYGFNLERGGKMTDPQHPLQYGKLLFEVTRMQDRNGIQMRISYNKLWDGHQYAVPVFGVDLCA